MNPNLFTAPFPLRQAVCPPVYLNHLLLSPDQTVRYLSLYLDRRLIWATHIHTKRLALNNWSLQLRFLLTSKHINLKNKLLLYKLFLKQIRTYGIQLWGVAKPSKLLKSNPFNPNAYDK
jgi:hypothetical protein